MEETIAQNQEIGCPICGARVFYKYGRTVRGKQRYLCLMCGRQYSNNGKGTEENDRPLCPRCGSVMYLYQRETKVIRFRCSRYPECPTYSKISIPGVEE